MEQFFWTPIAPHVEASAHVAHGSLPEVENVVPATHATLHAVSAVVVQAVFTPSAHVDAAAQVVHLNSALRKWLAAQVLHFPLEPHVEHPKA